MHNLVKKLPYSVQTMLKSRFLRVATIGFVGMSVQTMIFEILWIWLGVLRPSLATLVGAELGILTNFLLNNRYSFNDRAHAPLLLRLVRFHTVVSGSLVIQWIFVFTAESFTQNIWTIHMAYAAGIVIGFLCNYTGYRLWVWKHYSAPTL
jgi:dolichol-phosphate mannosyltransferase